MWNFFTFILEYTTNGLKDLLSLHVCVFVRAHCASDLVCGIVRFAEPSMCGDSARTLFCHTVSGVCLANGCHRAYLFRIFTTTQKKGIATQRRRCPRSGATGDGTQLSSRALQHAMNASLFATTVLLLCLSCTASNTPVEVARRALLDAAPAGQASLTMAALASLALDPPTSSRKAADTEEDGNPLNLILFDNATVEHFGARALDGSNAGYYFREGSESDSFVIFLQGGGKTSSLRRRTPSPVLGPRVASNSCSQSIAHTHTHTFHTHSHTHTHTHSTQGSAWSRSTARSERRPT